VAKASEIYCGRGFFEINKAAEWLGGEFTILSAGLGLVSSLRRIPAYNLTVSGVSPDNVQKKIGMSRFSACEWWTAVNAVKRGRYPLAQLVRANPASLFVLALSLPYWDLIAQDLRSLSPKALARVRIGGLARDSVPPWARDAILPYDNKLFNGPDSPLPGTLSDYPQRVCVHYVTRVLPVCGPGEDRRHIRDFMLGMRPPVAVLRQRLSDEELIELMRQGITVGQSSVAKMLRWLRDVQKIACEQGRCAKLLNAVKGYQ